MGISLNNGDSDRQVCCSSSSTPTSRNAESTVTGVQWHLWTTTVYRVGHRADRRANREGMQTIIDEALDWEKAKRRNVRR
jgi:hypothetical protein